MWIACYRNEDLEMGMETFCTKESALYWLEEQKEEYGLTDYESELRNFHGYVAKLVCEIKQVDIDNRDNYKDKEEFDEKYPTLPANCDIVAEYQLIENEV